MWLCRICGIPVHDTLVDIHAEKHIKEQQENNIDKVLGDALDSLVKQGFAKESEGGFKITEKGIEEIERRIKEGEFNIDKHD